MTRLKIALSRYPHTAALVDGEVAPEGVELDWVDITGNTNPNFRKMARNLEYDISELGISTAYSAKEVGLPITPLPVFVTRRFDHEAMYYNADLGIETPKDLEGRKVGVRSYTVTDVIWSRGTLADVYGVDSDAITWVVTGEEHIANVPLPVNCEFKPGGNLEEMLESGEIAAIINPYRGSAPQVRPLIADHKATEHVWLEKMGTISMHHTIVVRDSVLAEHPGLARDLVATFARAKQPMLDRLAKGEAPDGLADASLTGGWHVFGVDSADELVLPDPMPYGFEANRAVLEVFTRYAYDQHLISRPMALEEIFAPFDVP